MTPGCFLCMHTILVLLDNEGHIKITDFGLCKANMNDTTTRADSFVGTVSMLLGKHSVSDCLCLKVFRLYIIFGFHHSGCFIASLSFIFPCESGPRATETCT